MNISGFSPNVSSYATGLDSRAKSTQATSAANKAEDKSASAPGDKTAEKNVQPKLSTAELEQIRQLKSRDSAVRRHEQAHLATSGGFAVSAATFTYQKGPDGVDYAIGGEVSINMSAGRTPEETIARAKTIQAAALAPADPSGQDRAVAAQAQQMEQEARAQLAEQAIVKMTQREGQKEVVDKRYGAIGRSGSLAGSINAYA